MKGVTDLDEGTLRRVDWQELVPATILGRAFSATFKASYLLLGAFFIALFATIFATFNGSDRGGSVFRNATVCSQNIDKKSAPFDKSRRVEALLVAGEVGATALRLGETPRRPFVFSPSRAAIDVFAIVAAFWLGLAVSRTAVVRLASTSRSSTARSLKFAARRLPALALPVAAPIAFYCVAALVVAASRAANESTLGPFASLLGPFVAIALFALVVLFAITVVAFPLSATAIAAEKSDGFDAVSRGISYATQRPLHLVVYSFLAAILTGLGFALVVAASSATRELYARVFLENWGGIGGWYRFGWTRFWSDVLTAIPVAYLGICAVVYSAAIYFALRRSVDGTPFDQYNDDSTGRKSRRLRPILEDSKGAPTFADVADSDVAANPAAGANSENASPQNNDATSRKEDEN